MVGKQTQFIRDFTNAALRFDCDKVIDHDYAAFYARIFTDIDASAPRLLEIGAGGYGDPQAGGASGRVWSELLSDWSIVIIDLEPKAFAWPERTTFLQADQTDTASLKRIGEEHGPFDVIIDDGSHRNADIRTSLWSLFPYLKEGGHYVIEDTQTSYIPSYGGDMKRNSATTANLVRDLFDYANAPELPSSRKVPAIFRDTVEEVYFRHNIVDIRKRTAVRRSNLSEQGLASMLAEAEAVLDPQVHGPGYWLRRSRYLARLGQILPARQLLEAGRDQWPQDREINTALAWLQHLERGDGA
ncbi:hypothetical protein [Novosphingobium pentaromativorans]|uniref:O-methyl transferase n=1 Tax=Novosphingobium pentaromativorans US6-1 TaxID=1088721 RepID=G6ELG0_9SPHN|nr:hypothetical protein [Novosphingobium pentaromativorans]EHJ57841.1 O-methyl transferase [Novosphingobium pentaromativorans US6-1]